MLRTPRIESERLLLREVLIDFLFGMKTDILLEIN